MNSKTPRGNWATQTGLPTIEDVEVHKELLVAALIGQYSKYQVTKLTSHDGTVTLDKQRSWAHAISLLSQKSTPQDNRDVEKSHFTPSALLELDSAKAAKNAACQ